MRVKVHNAQLLILARYLLLKSKFGNQLFNKLFIQLLLFLLQIVEIILINSANKKEIKVIVTFDQGSQRSHTTERVKSFLNLISTCHGHMSISTYRNNTSAKKVLQKVCLALKKSLGNYFALKTLFTEFICLRLKNQPAEFTHKN